jgi:hypothetical protein
MQRLAYCVEYYYIVVQPQFSETILVFAREWQVGFEPLLKGMHR